MKFEPYKGGLYVFDICKLGNVNNNNNKPTFFDYSQLQTVDQNKSRYSDDEVARADQARTLYRRIGSPPIEHFAKILNSNYIRNCELTSKNAHRAIKIYGKDVVAIRGKSTKKK